MHASKQSTCPPQTAVSPYKQPTKQQPDPEIFMGLKSVSFVSMLIFTLQVFNDYTVIHGTIFMCGCVHI